MYVYNIYDKLYDNNKDKTEEVGVTPFLIFVFDIYRHLFENSKLNYFELTNSLLTITCFRI